MIEDDDFKAFQEEMKGVKPIKTKPRVDLVPKKVAEPAPETTAKAPRARRPRGQGLKRQR